MDIITTSQYTITDLNDGRSITTVDVEYYQSTSSSSLVGGSWSTTAPTWVSGQYIWSRVKTTYSSGDPTYTNAVCITGQAGTTGTGIASITEEYYLSTSKTAQTGGNWGTTVPVWSTGKYLWTRSDVRYSDAPSTPVYVGLSVDSSWEAVNEIEIGGRNLVTDSHFYNGVVNGWTSVYGIQIVENHILKMTFTSLTPASRIERVFYNLDIGTYTLTIYAKIPQNMAWSAWIGATPITPDPVMDPLNFKIYSVTFVVETAGDVTVRGYVPNIPISSIIEIDWFKLEKGNKATDWTPAPEDVDAKIDAAAPLIIGTQTGSTSAWTGVVPFAVLTDKQQIAYKLPFASTSTSVTLNLTLSGGGTTGAIAAYYGSSTRLTTHYGQGSIIRLTYLVNNVTAGGTLTGWWADGNYVSSDTYDRTKYNRAIKAKTALTAGWLAVADSTNEYFHLAYGGTNPSFQIDKPILYVGSAITAGATGTNNYVMYSTVSTRTNSLNASLAFTIYQVVYLKGTLAGLTFTPTQTTNLYTTTPIDDGSIYMAIGQLYNTYNMTLYPQHELYMFKNGVFKSFQQIAVEGYDTAVIKNTTYTGTITQKNAQTGMKIGDIWIVSGELTTAAYQNGRTYYCISETAGSGSWVMTAAGTFTGSSILQNNVTGDLEILAANTLTLATNGLLSITGTAGVQIGSTSKIAIVSGGDFTVNAGSGSSFFGINAKGTNVLFSGATDANATAAKFKVTNAGALTATDATITGTITANLGYIGGATGFTIASQKLYSSTKSTLTTNVDGVYLGIDGMATGILSAGGIRIFNTGYIESRKLNIRADAGFGSFTTYFGANATGQTGFCNMVNIIADYRATGYVDWATGINIPESGLLKNLTSARYFYDSDTTQFIIRASSFRVEADTNFYKFISGSEHPFLYMEIGFIYISTSSTSPSTLFGGIWASIPPPTGISYMWKRTA